MGSKVLMPQDELFFLVWIVSHIITIKLIEWTWGGGIRAQHFAAAGKACRAHRCEYTLCLLRTCVRVTVVVDRRGQIKSTNRIFYLTPERTVKKQWSLYFSSFPWTKVIRRNDSGVPSRPTLEPNPQAQVRHTYSLFFQGAGNVSSHCQGCLLKAGGKITHMKHPLGSQFSLINTCAPQTKPLEWHSYKGL